MPTGKASDKLKLCSVATVPSIGIGVPKSWICKEQDPLGRAERQHGHLRGQTTHGNILSLVSSTYMAANCRACTEPSSFDYEGF